MVALYSVFYFAFNFECLSEWMCMGASRRVCVRLCVSFSNMRGRIPCPLLFGSMTYMSPPHSSRKSWKDTVKTDLRAIAINQPAWIDIQKKRLECRGLCKEDVTQIALAQDESVDKPLTCPVCRRSFHSPRTLPLAQVFSSASQAYLRPDWSNSMAAVSSPIP